MIHTCVRVWSSQVVHQALKPRISRIMLIVSACANFTLEESGKKC